MKKVGWGITGAGHLLSKTFEVMEKLAKNHKISCFISSAGEQIIRIYGLQKKLGEICPGGYYQEIFSEVREGAASPSAGRFLRGTYDALVVSPASSNTIAKIVSGISDTLVTNAIAQAEKGKIPIIIVPTDRDLGGMKTKLPPYIDRSTCEGCEEECRVPNSCPVNAIFILEGLPKIDLSKCNSCGACKNVCPKGATILGKEIRVSVRRIDVENVEKLRKRINFSVIWEPCEIPDALSKVLGERVE